MTFYLNLAQKALDNGNADLAGRYLKRALSMANKECRSAKGEVMKALNHVRRI